MTTGLRTTTLAAAAAAALALILSAPASPAALAGCSGQQLAQPFRPWLDLDNYTLAGDGGFEAGATGWKLSGGASVVTGNEPWHVHAAADSRSLSLPAGAKAVSPATCIGLLHPTARLFARGSGGTLMVDTTITVLGLSVVLPVGAVVPGQSFAPTLPLPLLANLTSPLSGSTGTATLTFTALGGPVAIDDVYVDPFKVN
jgi:hypothetical protein